MVLGFENNKFCWAQATKIVKSDIVEGQNFALDDQILPNFLTWIF